MATTPFQDVNLGSYPNDGTGDPIRDAFDKLNSTVNALSPAGGVKYINLTDGPRTYSGTEFAENSVLLVSIGNMGQYSNPPVINRNFTANGGIILDPPTDGGMNIRLLYPPDTSATAYTLVLRDANGDIYANNVIGTTSGGGNSGGVNSATITYVQTSIYNSLTAYTSSTIADVYTTIAASTYSLSQTVLGLSSQYTNLASSLTNYATINLLNTTVATSSSALSSRIDSLTAVVNGIASTSGATVLYVDTAVANSTASLASAVQTLTSNVNSLTTTVTQFSQSINGILGKWGVTINNNGYISGIQLLSGATSSSFIVDATKFVVTGTGLTNGLSPFVITNGLISWGGSLAVGAVTATNIATGTIVANNIQAGTLTADKFSISSLSAITANLGTVTAGVIQNSTGRAKFDLNSGTIVFNNGAYMKVQGIGFGSSNQFIEWFGPYLTSLSSCTEANAVFYLKNTGGAYFGGTLLAGRLTNSVQGTVLTQSNIADLGPFSSNGGQITVTYSYVYVINKSYPPTTQGLANYTAQNKQATSATIVLSRSLGGSAFTDVLTIPVPLGTVNASPPNLIDVAPGSIYKDMGVSGTYVDPSLSTLSREYKLRISYWSTTTMSPPDTNTLSIQSLE